MFNWFGGFLLVGVNGASAGVFLSDSNDATNSFANIVGVSAYKPGKPIPFVELARENVDQPEHQQGARIQGSGFATMVGGYQSGTPNSDVEPRRHSCRFSGKVRRGSSRVSRAGFAPFPTART